MCCARRRVFGRRTRLARNLDETTARPRGEQEARSPRYGERHA